MVAPPPKTKTIRQDGHEIIIRETAERHPCSSLYEIDVDGIHRGWIGYIRNHRNGIKPRWQAYTHLPQPSHFGTDLLRNGSLWAEARGLHGSSLDEIARKFPMAVVAGNLPDRDEALAILHAADAKNLEREDRNKLDRDTRQAAELAAAEENERQRSDFTEALRSIRTRLSSHLTNFEADAIERMLVSEWLNSPT
jgi:hypothetical protein